jgi:hypothetical protein
MANGTGLNSNGCKVQGARCKTDYELYEKTVPVDLKLTGLMPTKVVLGRLETINPPDSSVASSNVQ